MASRKLTRQIELEAEREGRAIRWLSQNELSPRPVGGGRKFLHGFRRKRWLPPAKGRGGPAGGSAPGLASPRPGWPDGPSRALPQAGRRPRWHLNEAGHRAAA